MTNPSNLPNLPAIIGAAAQTVQTDYPAEQAADLVALAKRVSGDNVEHIVLGPPYAARPAGSGLYYLKLDIAKVREVAARIFGAASGDVDAAGGATP
jgi:anionic cell wall polymer biosynthesis LytR-Cps2A-Psr (LCP) family protein